MNTSAYSLSEHDGNSKAGDKSAKRVIVIGTGDGGCSVLAHMARQSREWPRLVCINSDFSSLAGVNGVELIKIESALGKAPEKGGVVGASVRAMADDVESVKQLCANADVLMLVVGLGGRAGMSVAMSVIEAASASGAFTLCFAILPFDFEGARRRENASRAIAALHEKAGCVICIPGQRLFKGVEQQLSVADAFHKVDDIVARGVYATWRGLCGRECGGGIELGFQDLRALIAAGNGRCVFACAEADGVSKVDDVLKEITASPMLNEGKALENAGAVLINVVCGTGVSLLDMTRIVSGTLPPGRENALLKIGVFCDPAWSDRLCVMIIVTERAERSGAGPHSARTDRASSTGGSPGEKGSVSVADVEAVRKVPRPEVHREKLKQQNLFDSDKVGRFKGIDPTIVDGNNLDIPTFIRRGILVRKQRANA